MNRHRAQKGVAYAIFFLAAALLWVFPLYTHDRYFDIIDAKLVYYCVHILAGGLAAVAAIACTRPWSKGENAVTPNALPAGAYQAARPRVRAASLSAVAFAAACLLSFLLSSRKSDALLGVPSRWNGLLPLLACCALYLLVYHLGDTLPLLPLMYGMLACFGAVCALAIANHLGFDPLHMYTFLPPGYASTYSSTIGNINFLGAYINLCLPVAAYGALTTRRPAAMALYYTACLLGFGGLVAANSDSALLAFAVFCLLAACQKGFTFGRGLRLLFLLGLLLACGGLLALLAAGRGGAANTPRGLTALLAHPACLVVGLVLAALAFWALCGTKQRPLYARPLHKASRIAAAATAALSALALAAVNMGEVRFGPPLDKLLVLDARWGSNRGYVWGRLWYTFWHYFSPREMLAGTGPDTVDFVINPRYTAYIEALNKTTFDSAHNEYLHLLVGVGILGLLCWLAFLFFNLRGLLSAEPPLASAFGLAGAAYAVQAVVNIAMPTSLPLLFLLLALRQVALRSAGAGRQAAAPPPRIWPLLFVAELLCIGLCALLIPLL